MAGPGVFTVTSRDTIEAQVSRLSVIGVAIIATLLLLVYRSLTALHWVFCRDQRRARRRRRRQPGLGVVHGITLGFGTALIGEAVDYSIYLFVQSEQGGSAQQAWIERFWPTIRLGVLTSDIRFCFAAAFGLSRSGATRPVFDCRSGCRRTVTRFVLPHLLPANFRIHDVSAIGLVLSRLLRAPRTAMGGGDTGVGRLRLRRLAPRQFVE